MNREKRDYYVDIPGVADPQDRIHEVDVDAKFQGRPWLSVMWRCCSVYSRIYRNKQGTAYEGQCPKCGKRAKAKIGPGGTNNRFFEAS